MPHGHRDAITISPFSRGASERMCFHSSTFLVSALNCTSEASMEPKERLLSPNLFQNSTLKGIFPASLHTEDIFILLFSIMISTHENRQRPEAVYHTFRPGDHLHMHIIPEEYRGTISGFTTAPIKIRIRQLGERLWWFSSEMKLRCCCVAEKQFMIRLAPLPTSPLFHRQACYSLLSCP